MAPGSEILYKIKLENGRVLGPLDLDRIRKLILKNHVVGREVAREHPNGEWRNINLIPEIARLFIERAQGALQKTGTQKSMGPTMVLPGSTEILPGSKSVKSFPSLQTLSVESGKNKGSSEKSFAGPTHFDLDGAESANLEDGTNAEPAVDGPGEDVSEGKTQMMPNPPPAPYDAAVPAERDRTLVSPPGAPESDEGSQAFFAPEERSPISQEPTVVFQRSSSGPLPAIPREATRGKGWERLKATAAALALGVAAYQILLPEPESKAPPKWVPIKAELPAFVQGNPDPAQSQKLFLEAMRLYVSDNVLAYQAAAEKLRQAAAIDPGNVKAVAMLAACYLNLIDSSNKDEKYFSVISKLIEMSRAKSVDLPETVIADVEFFITANKAEAAQQRILEFTKTHQYGSEMVFYLALTHFERGAFQEAQGWIERIPDDKVFSPRIFYLRGMIAEKLDRPEEAMASYLKATKQSSDHLKSRVRIAILLDKQGKLGEAGGQLEYAIKRSRMLPPNQLAEAYYYYGLYMELHKKWDEALGYIERAVRLDKKNQDYLLEMYTLRARAGDSSEKTRADAKMYVFLKEGEKLLKLSQPGDALNQFLLARQANLNSFIPLVRIGDMFKYQHDLSNARLNYKMAAEKAPSNIDVWSKYLDVLIQSYEWEEAQKAMDRFRKLPVNQSAIDKAAADMYQRQARYREAQMFYRKAMERDVIDSEVYIAYAKSLMSTKNFRDAPFFFALALRFDPLNTEALVGTAKCIAETESIDRAIIMLQDELQKGTGAKAELLAAIAELQIQKGDWNGAQSNVEQAMQANPDYGYPWKLQAQIYMNRENERGMVDKALQAYKSYSERNRSDPSGYLERYRLFIKKTDYENAMEELHSINRTIPRYPNLHYYFGALYSIMGNHKASVEELKTELGNNPTSIPAMISLGRELLTVGAPQDALTQFTHAMQIQPRNPESKHMAGWANYLLKNYAAALALLRSAAEIDRANPLIHKRIGQVCREMGDPMCAAEGFRKYLEMEPDAVDKNEVMRYLQ